MAGQEYVNQTNTQLLPLWTPAGQTRGGRCDWGEGQQLRAPRLPACRAFLQRTFHYEVKPDQEKNEALTARLVESAHERRRFAAGCTPCWNAKVRTPITSAAIACIVRRGWLCGSVAGVMA